MCLSKYGIYNNFQVIDSNWVKDIISPQVIIDELDYNFGYYWWIDNLRDIHFIWGHRGQFAFIVPSKDIEVIMTSIPNPQGDYQIQADEALPVIDRIIDASF